MIGGNKKIIKSQSNSSKEKLNPDSSKHTPSHSLILHSPSKELSSIVSP